MILADTSVWIIHLRDRIDALAHRAAAGHVACHPVVIGELACGMFSRRREILDMLHDLPQLMEAQHEEVLQMIESHRLMGTGIGWPDAHLLASAVLNEVPLWTLDKRLDAAAKAVGVRATA